MNNTIKITKGTLFALLQWLSRTPLAGQESRYRSRFIKEYSSVVDDIDKLRVEKAEELATKDADGNALKELDEYGKERFAFTEENKKTLGEFWEALLAEEYHLDVVDETKPVLRGVKNILLKSTDKHVGSMATSYDEWCSIFESADLK